MANKKTETKTKTAKSQPDRTENSAADAIRPFVVDVQKGAITDLNRRLAATRWPEQETVSDQSQGSHLATMKKLVRYWQTDYDWGKCEAKLKAVPHFITEID